MKRKCNCGAFLPEGGKCSRCGAQIEMPKPSYCDDHCLADELREAHKAEVERLEQRIRILENPRVTNEDFKRLAEMQRDQIAQLTKENAELKEQLHK